MKYKIYVVGPSINYANWMGCELVNTIEESDLVLFTGGEDVHPSLYKEDTNPRTYFNVNRDAEEILYFQKALDLGKKFIGICRGSQFLCAMSGGKLIQHMSHPNFHEITYFNGDILEVTSSHHQMMYPYNLDKNDYILLGWTQNISKYHLGGDDEEMELPNGIEPEIVYFKNTQSLCIQSHPEWQPSHHPTVNKLRELLGHHLNNTIEDYLKVELV